jgi:hypothetical protein
MAGFLKGAARAGIEQGLGMGWGDEAEAWLRSKLGDQSYEDALKQIHQEQGKFAEEHPIVQPVSEFVGGAAPLVASYMMPGAQVSTPATTTRTLGALAKLSQNPYIRGAVTGAVTGGISGAGSAEPDMRGSGAASGAVIGTGLGAGMPAATRAGKGVLDMIRERVNPSESFITDRALGKLNKAISDSGITPADIRAKISADRLVNVPSVMANVDPSLADLAENVAQRTGAGARTIENALLQQKAGARERAYQQVNKGLNPGDYYADLEAIQKDLKTKADPHYKAAYATGEVTDPEVLKFMELPQFKQGLSKAEELLAAEGRKIDMSKPTVEVLDQVKRGLDRLIEGETNPTTGTPTSLGRVYTQKKNEFLDALDAAVPEYAKARAIYRGDAELADAMRKGINEFNKMDHEQVDKLVSNMSDAEKQSFRTGVARDLYDKIMRPSYNFNVAQKVFGGTETQDKLKPLFNNNGEFKLFKHAMERESQLFEQANKILGGSQTGKRMQMREEFEQGPNTGEFIANALSGGFGSSLSNMAIKAMRNTEMSEKTASKLADMLMEKDPHKVAASVKLIEDYANRAAPKAEALKATEAGLIGGSATSIYPAPESPEKTPNLEEDLSSMPDIQGPDIEEDLKKLQK